MPFRREIRDPIHGFIQRSDIEEDVIDTAVFQRLRRIRQLGLASLVYPGALHTRFDHCIGTMHVAGKIARAVGLESEHERLVRLAGLLHDLGHPPFSHVSEPVLESLYDRDRVSLKPGQQIHEAITAFLISTDASLKRLLSEQDRERVIGVLNGSYGDAILKSIVSGPLDADKQDYLLRDSYFCGVQYGIYDLDRLSNTLTVHEDSEDKYLAIHEDGVNALEQFVLAKNYMHAQVYRHKIRLITDAMIRRALELGISVDNISWLRSLFRFDGSEGYLDEYKRWSDERLITEILYGNTPDGYAKTLFRALMDRRLHKRITHYQLTEFDDPLVRDKLSDLSSAQRTVLEKRIGQYLDIDPRLVVVQRVTFKSVREESRNTEAQILIIRAGSTKNFDAVSTLFSSINAAVQEQKIEIYAPMSYADEKQKRKLRAKHQAEIRELISAFVKDNLLTAEGES